jgi:hypothetical protein
MALVAWLTVLCSVGAVEGLRKQPGRCGLSCTSRSREQVCVSNLVLDDLAGECLYDMVLADDLVEPLGSILAIERLILHWSRQ